MAMYAAGIQLCWHAIIIAFVVGFHLFSSPSIVPPAGLKASRSRLACEVFGKW